MPHLSTIPSRKALVKRIPTRIDRTDGIQRYDLDNLYPQRLEEVAKRSGITTDCIEILGDFLEGKGFVNREYNGSIINANDETVGNLLTFNTRDYSVNGGFALHFNFNLNGAISEVNPIFFKYCRLGIPDLASVVHDIKFSLNWEQEPAKTIEPRRVIKTFPVFNPDPEIVLAQIEAFEGIDNYPGQILYFTELKGQYPRATFDSVAESAQTDGNIQVFELNNIEEGFFGGTVVHWPTDIKDDDEMREVTGEVRKFKGQGGAGGIMIIPDPDGNIDNLIEQLQTPNMDKMFDLTNKNVTNRIILNYATPKPLLGVDPNSGIFNIEDYENSYTYYNIKTQKKRKLFSGVYQKWTPFFFEQINASQDYAIEPASFSLEGAETEATGDPDPEPEPEPVE